MAAHTTSKESKSPRRTGRPTKLTPAIRRKILSVLKAGNYRNVAAAVAGISPERLSKWMAMNGEPYESFRQAVIETEKQVEIELVTGIVTAGKKDPDIALKYLERKYHDRWGRKDRHEVTGKDGAPMAVQIYLPREDGD